MKGRINKSSVVALGAAVAAVGAASHVQAQAAPDGVVTYIMSIDDNGLGQQSPGSFAIYAIDGTVNPDNTITPNSVDANGGGVDGGISNFNLAITGATTGTLRDVVYGGMTLAGHSGAGKLRNSNYYSLTDGSPDDVSNVEAGFTYPSLHHDDNSTQVADGQDVVGTPPSLNNVVNGNVSTLIIFGLGQSAGNMQTFANSTTGNNPGIPSNTELNSGSAASAPFAGPGTVTFAPNVFLTGLLVATGNYGGGNLPTIDLTHSTTGLLAAYDEPFNTTIGGYPGAGASTQLALMTQTLGVPEPASVGLFGLGAMGLLGRRRRRDAAKK